MYSHWQVPPLRPAESFCRDVSVVFEFGIRIFARFVSSKLPNSFGGKTVIIIVVDWEISPSDPLYLTKDFSERDPRDDKAKRCR